MLCPAEASWPVQRRHLFRVRPSRSEPVFRCARPSVAREFFNVPSTPLTGSELISSGITGLAQVNGCRGETSKLEEMEARVNYDLDYLRHWSPMLDVKILLLTVVKVFRDDKAY